MKSLIFLLMVALGFAAGSITGFTTSVNNVEQTVKDLQYSLEVSEAKVEFWRSRAEGGCGDPDYEKPEEIAL